MNNSNPNGLSYEALNEGSREGSVVQSCGRWYLKAIIDDLQTNGIRFATNVDLFISLDSGLEPNLILPVQNMFLAIEACRRLRSDLELFPSDDLMIHFFREVAGFVQRFSNLLEAFDMSDAYALASKINSSTRVMMLSVSGDVLLPQGLGNVPHWHRLNVTQNSWNKWLDNRPSNSFPNKIVQRIPAVVITIVNKITFKYQIVEETFERAGRIVRSQPNNRHELSRATGENHEIPRLIHGVNWTFIYIAGCSHENKMKEKVNGVISLEKLSCEISIMSVPRRLRTNGGIIFGELRR